MGRGLKRQGGEKKERDPSEFLKGGRGRKLRGFIQETVQTTSSKGDRVSGEECKERGDEV